MNPEIHLVFWLPYIVLLIHTIEEVPGFSKWATRHFAPMSTYKHVNTQVCIILLVLLVSYKASFIGYNGIWIMLAVAFQLHLGINSLFHLITTVLYKEYSPGLLTAITLSLPSTIFFFHQMYLGSRLTIIELAVSLILGTIIGVSAIGTLFLKPKEDRGR